MNGEMDRVWKESGHGLFEVLSWQWTGTTEEIHETSRSGVAYEPGEVRMRCLPRVTLGGTSAPTRSLCIAFMRLCVFRRLSDDVIFMTYKDCLRMLAVHIRCFVVH
jgi:hypothetical protein